MFLDIFEGEGKIKEFKHSPPLPLENCKKYAGSYVRCKIFMTK
jgi:hypothetical protein